MFFSVTFPGADLGSGNDCRPQKRSNIFQRQEWPFLNLSGTKRTGNGQNTHSPPEKDEVGVEF
jgi:hypothetical protein